MILKEIKKTQKYNPQEIEAKWQKVWKESGIYKTKDLARKSKFYALDFFPYPSGAGLHVGHPKGYVATDVVARLKMLQGANVLHPMGWDAFGLPAENYAIKNKIHPRTSTEKNIAVFKKQLEKFGFTYDWDREISTIDPEFYKWTQWIFLKMFEKGLAYESDEPVNWCPSCKTVLANEDLEAGLCERCGTQVVQKKMKQWVLKMTAYADRLLADLDKKDLEWEDLIKDQQKNWIGRSEGAEVEFRIKNHESRIKVYTTRLDTIFGCTYCVVAPEHKLIAELKEKIGNYPEIEKYIIQAQNKTNLERTELQKEKTGVELKGIKAVNPFTSEEIPVWVADYVLGFYGTGAVMAVPAHDERDFEFAKKYNLPVIPVIFNSGSVAAYWSEDKKQWKIQKYSDEWNKQYSDDGKLVESGQFSGLTSVKAREEMTKWLEEKKIGKRKVNYKMRDWVFSRQRYWGEPIPIIKCRQCGLKKLNIKMELNFRVNEVWNQIISNKKIIETRALNPDEKDRFFGDIKIGDFIRFNNKNTNEFEIIRINKVYNFKGLNELFEEKNIIGKIFPEAKIEDISQFKKYFSFTDDYLGRIEKNGLVGWEFEKVDVVENISVPEKDLPVRLPEVESYEPTGTGESPLANIVEWVNTKCPKCGLAAKRETNTMPQWAGSSWYYLRFIDPKNSLELVSKEKEKYWMNVDLYVGGAEHATRHLLYARFWHKFLCDIGAVSTEEPFKKLFHVGLILAEDGRKMSKRWNNVINPDDVIREFGADSFRLYEMFMGPFSQSVSWNTKGVVGMRRFLERIWNLNDKCQMANDKSIPNDKIKNVKTERLLHKTIKKVGEDIENFKFNTSISALMILSNELEKQENIPKESFEKFLILLSPFTPHIAEELWSGIGNKESIFLSRWPKYNPDMIKDEEIEIIFQVNGKLREKIRVSANITEEQAKKLALMSEKTKNELSGKEIKKVIFVKGRLINFVV